jgi:glutamyl-tRNA synthetase
MPVGRFAPSPTGALHLGNLRTALLAWLWARSDGSRFDLRFEDLDAGAVQAEHYDSQAADLRALGLDWDGAPTRQSERVERYREAVRALRDAGLTYECWCTRREVREAAQAPNGPLPPGAYPGTCRQLTAAERSRRRRRGRRPAARLRVGGRTAGFDDELAGACQGAVDDFVISRGDDTPAYNLAVVVDDAAQGIELVVRGDDLLDSTPRQVVVAELLGLPVPRYAHVPLVLSPAGDRLAKRDGAVTLGDRVRRGESPAEVLGVLAASVGLCEPGEVVAATELVERFDPALLPRRPWVLEREQLADGGADLHPPTVAH